LSSAFENLLLNIKTNEDKKRRKKTKFRNILNMLAGRFFHPMAQNTFDRLVTQLQEDISREFYIALGIEKHPTLCAFARRLISRPALRFAELTAEFDQDVGQLGFQQAGVLFLRKFVRQVDVSGVENIPPDGPLVIASNHPGAFDSPVIVRNIPRPDLKIIVSGIPFLENLPHARQHLIYSTEDTQERSTAVRQTLRHLKSGGAFLTFASGNVDPEPALMPDAKEFLERWSPSLVVLLERNPLTRLLPVIVSSVLEARHFNGWIARTRKTRRDRQKLAEFLMVSQILTRGCRFEMTPRVTFGEPLGTADLPDLDDRKAALQAIVAHAKNLLEFHQSRQAQIIET
jgi:hypothetical protein